MHNEFFSSQSDLTAAKILIYRQYLNNYLAKVLMQYGQCYIADFFCGCGKNGREDGSPLVLLKTAVTMLEENREEENREENRDGKPGGRKTGTVLVLFRCRPLTS